MTYTALGNNKYSKEFFQIYFDGKIIIINDYKKLEDCGVKIKKIKSTESNKGQYEELIEFAKYLKGEMQSPIPLWQLIKATKISFNVKDKL